VDPTHGVDCIGSVPAAVLAQLAIMHLSPSLVLNAGTCGGFQSKGHAIAQVFVGTRYVAFHHRRNTIPAMREYGIGKYPVCRSSRLREALGLPEGIVSSGDALDYSAEDREYIAANGGTLKEMEAAAIGWICGLSGTPLLPLKTITDWVDHPADTGEQFYANLAAATESLTRELLRVLRYLAEHLEDEVWGASPI
jgi:nucleoside phosphorylase